MAFLLKSLVTVLALSASTAFASLCDERLHVDSFADRQGSVSDFVHITVEDELWAKTIFGSEAVETEFRGRSQTAGGLVTVMSGNQLDVYWGGRKITYFDFAAGKAQQSRGNDGYTTNVILPGAENLQFVFVYTPGMRRTLEIWVKGISSRPAQRKILTARSGLEFFS